MIPEPAVAHYQLMQGIQSAAVLVGRRAWANVDPGSISGSWASNLAVILPVVSAYQEQAALAGARYGAATLAAQGLYEAPEAFVDPRGFAGTASDGRSLEGLLYSAATQAKTMIAGGAPARDALKSGRSTLETLLRTQVADAGRGAAGVDVATRRKVGYVRMLNPPSCPRCVILAGRFYRWNAGFARHPRCDCIHVPSTENVAGDATTDPYAYFESLSEAEQDKAFGRSYAQSVRDGGDIFQIVNARRGMRPGGLTTTEGTSRRGNFRASGGTGQRLTPEGIYQQAKTREEALRLLESNGYILPGGQNPTGSILGQREGVGALGRGGTRVGARETVLEARRTGVRDPRLRATMTEAERRAFDAQANWDAVRSGRNPYQPSRPLSPSLAAAVENDYRNTIVHGNTQWKLTARRNL